VKPLRRIRLIQLPKAGREPAVDALLREIDVLTERVAALTRQARTDPLTGLPNRLGWDEQLTRELARARRTGEPLSLALLDLDHFKAFNDAHGHQAGDRLLVAATAAWNGELREIDTLCRWGGDEFAVLLPSCPKADADDVIARLAGATPSRQSCAAGVAGWDGSESFDSLLGRADSHLLDAKGPRGRWAAATTR
jgi:diguanylate cyclase (GGDEF)-like protein